MPLPSSFSNWSTARTAPGGTGTTTRSDLPVERARPASDGCCAGLDPGERPAFRLEEVDAGRGPPAAAELLRLDHERQLERRESRSTGTARPVIARDPAFASSRTVPEPCTGTLTRCAP